MPRYAFLAGNVVSDVIVADSQPDGWIPAQDSAPGWIYNTESGEFTAVEPAPPKRFITKRAFWNRFPSLKEAVMRAIRLSAPAGTAMLAGVLDRLNSRVDASPYVNLDDAQTIEGIEWLASVQCPASVTLDGVSYDMRLTAQERDAVLLAEIQESETYP